METHPLVSIVLPTYNGSRYLEQSIRSCIDQTLTDWELIVVDDCSTDATPDVIRRFVAADPRIRSLRHETNKRLPGGLNTGFAQARGRYFTWTSDDNLFRPTALAELVAHLEARPDVGLVYSAMSVIDEDGAEIDRLPAFEPRLLAYTNVVGACFMYRREVARAVGPYADHAFCAEDWDYWLRISERFKLDPLTRDLYLYRVHQGSLSQSKRDRVERAIASVLSEHLPRMTWCPRAERAQGYLVVSSLRRKQGVLKGMGALFRALTLAPTYTVRRAVAQVARRAGLTTTPMTPEAPLKGGAGV